MANLKYGEKGDLEALLGMRTGYVLDFTNSQFAGSLLWSGSGAASRLVFTSGLLRKSWEGVCRGGQVAGRLGSGVVARSKSRA